MPLSEDQKRTLRFLAQREEGLEELAALKDRSVDEVRTDVKAALDELDAPPLPPQSPAPAAPAPPPLSPMEKAVEEPAPATSPKPNAPSKPTARPPRSPMPAERRRLLTLTGGALALVAVVLGAIALFSGGGDDSEPGGTAADGDEIAAIENDDRVTRAILEPADGGDATGIALFGRIGKEEVVLQVATEGLEPTAPGESYTIWLYRSPQVALRVGSVKVEEGEELAARFPIPAELLTYVAGGAFNQVYISRTSDATYKREVALAQKQKRLPSYSGETVLSGAITGPLAEAAAKQGR